MLLLVGAAGLGFLGGGWLALHWVQPTPGSELDPEADTGHALEPASVVSESQPIYNVRTAPPTTYNPQLQETVNQMVAWVAQQGLPLPALSITLMDVTQPERPQIAGYRQQEGRYPASVVKLFWLVMFFAYQQAGLITPNQVAQSDLHAMMQQSSNDAASRVVDALTRTESGAELPPGEFPRWQQQREQINHFFRGAEYGYLNLKHKNFPIYSLGQEEPQGRELQLRGGLEQPSRNQLTTWQTARLLYEIYTLQAVSPALSQKMLTLMERPAAVRSQNLAGFLGANLPIDAHVLGKEGQTSTCRQDAVIITRTDGRLAYILVVFGDDPAYSADDRFLPALSRLSWQAMNRIYP
ncbi:MAG: serine hydrolase [Gloeomargarita sp. DG02_4_bins_56]